MKLPKGPTLKLPGRGNGGAAAKPRAAVPRPNVQPPAFVENVYRDLRDRRLLIPALVLLVALIAVPVMLKAEEAPPPPVAAPVVPAEATAVEPAVLAERLGGVRDYRERLDALKQRNPFKQQYLVPTPKGEAVESVDSSPSETLGTTGGGAASVSGGAVGGSTLGTTEPEPATEPQPTQILVYAPRVDLIITHNGKHKRYKAVKPGELLPDRSTPIAMFAGAPQSLENARFLLSSDVTATEGDGHCAPSANDCQFLKLADGEKRLLVYGLEAERYSIKVTDIRAVLVDKRKRD